jgi:hypothetical protein
MAGLTGFQVGTLQADPDGQGDCIFGISVFVLTGLQL